MLGWGERGVLGLMTLPFASSIVRLLVRRGLGVSRVQGVGLGACVC